MADDIEAKIERMLGDGLITQQDADTVYEFADFLRDKAACGGDPLLEVDVLIKYADLCGFTPEQVERLREAKQRGAET